MKLDSALPREWLRYGVAGACAFAADLAVLLVLAEHFAVHYLWAAVAGYACGLLVAYLLNVRWVFRFRRVDNRWAEFAIFNGIVLVGLGLNQGILYLLIENAWTGLAAAKVVAAGCITIVNYLARRWLLFTDWSRDASASEPPTSAPDKDRM